MKSSRFSCILVFGGCLLALLGSGCSGKSKSATVTGTVNLDGSPLPFAMIKFHTSSEKAREKEKSAEIKDGAFEVRDVPVGDVKITIDTEKMMIMYNPRTIQTQLDALNANKKKILEDAKKFNQTPDTTQMDEQITKLTEDLKKSNDITKKLKGTKVPPIYGDEKTTTLKYTITGGSQTLDPIELKSGK